MTESGSMPAIFSRSKMSIEEWKVGDSIGRFSNVSLAFGL